MEGKRRTPLPRSPTRKRTPRSKPVQRPNGETERLAVRRRDAMKYRLGWRELPGWCVERQQNAQRGLLALDHYSLGAAGHGTVGVAAG